jgi:hypothetical protein
MPDQPPGDPATGPISKTAPQAPCAQRPVERQLGQDGDERSRVSRPRDQTWNICPDCGHSWTDRVPTPGILHRTQRCTACRRAAKADVRGDLKL